MNITKVTRQRNNMELKVGDTFKRIVHLPAPNPVIIEKANMFWQEFDIAYNNSRLGFFQRASEDDPGNVDTYGYTVLDISDEVVEFKIEFTGDIGEDGFQETLVPTEARVVNINYVNPAIVRHLFMNKYKMQTPKDFLNN